MKITRISLFAALAMTSSSFAATISLNDLASQTPTNTVTTGGQIEGDATGPVNDPNLNDGDSNLSSSADVTFAWDMTLVATSPVGTARRTIFEFGGGNGTGTSVTWFGNTIFAQVEQGTSQLGGNGNNGDSAALSYSVSAGDLNVEKTWTVSIDTDAANPTMTLFVDNVLIGSVTANVSVTDWSGTNDGGFWNPAVAGNSVLLESHANGTGAIRPPATEATVNLTTGLRMYEDTFVNVVPEPSAISLLALSGLALLRRRRK